MPIRLLDRHYTFTEMQEIVDVLCQRMLLQHPGLYQAKNMERMLDIHMNAAKRIRLLQEKPEFDRRKH